MSDGDSLNAIEDSKFFGDRIGDMNRKELLEVIDFLSDENEKLEQKYADSERGKADLIRSGGV